ncbi:hypothetical protein QUB47_31315 [Microcoleus sp. AT9_B5]
MLDDSIKVVTIDEDSYIVRAQEYRYLVAENSPEIVSKTYIEVLKLLGEMEVTQFTGDGTELVGYLYRTHDLANSNPEMWDIPKFIPFEDQFYDEKRATYFGDTGFDFAKKELEKLSEFRLVQGIKRYLIKDYDRKIIVCLRMYDACREGWFTAFKTDLIAFKAPEIYKWNNSVFRLTLTADEDETTTAYYTLSGKYKR